MKKLSTLAFVLLFIFCAVQSTAYAAEPVLIKNTQLTLSPANAPNRLEVSFYLSEPIDLSQENTNIIIEYLGENLESTNYIKEKSWSGYLNSYDAYPSGERKYSSGLTNENYSDIVPATKIYTSTRTGARIDITKVSAVNIAVFRADGSGEVITVSNDGSILDFEEVAPNNGGIEDPGGNETEEQALGIKMDSGTSVLPPNTILVAEELSGGSVYNVVSSLMADAVNFIAFDIKLNSNGEPVRPDGKVKISIPVPDSFNRSNLAVYRIDNDGRKIPYDVTIEGMYATFLTDHFSTYVLVEERTPQIQKENNQNQNTQLRAERRTARENKTEEIKPLETTEIEENRIPLAGEMPAIEENKIPITGRAQTQDYMAAIIFIIGLLLPINIKRISKAR